MHHDETRDCRPTSCPDRRVVRGGLAALVASLIAVCGVWISAPPAAAHDELVSSDPSESGLISIWPSRATLTFSGQVKEVHEITVTGPDGSVTNGEPTASGIEVRQTIGTGPDGPYTLTYDVVSADGHEIAGEIHFEVGPASTEAADPADASDSSDPADASAASGAGSSDGPGVIVPVVGLLAALVAGAAVFLRRRHHAASRP